MVHRVNYSRLSTRIAEEKQLLAEEKWIIEALTKIRNQRNCLQIERLELDSLKTQLIMNSRSQLSSPRQPGPSEPAPLDSAMKLMSNPAGAVLQELEEALAKDLAQENLCNGQQLDLTVTNPILSLNVETVNVEEVEDSDASDDFHDEENSLMIDMNMFMNGNNPL